MTKKIALGKGIASLIQETPNQILSESLREEKKGGETGRDLRGSSPLLVDIANIRTNSKQPRKIFKKRPLEELAESIRENGIIQPLIATETEKGIELVAGERRLRAARMAGLEKVPIVLKRTTERDKMVMSIIENVQRADLNCVEEALAYHRLMEEFSLTQEEVAKRVGKERSSVANFLRILKLPRDVIDLLQKELLSFGHAKVLAGIKDRGQAIRLAGEAAERELSIRDLEKLARKDTSSPLGGEGLGGSGANEKYDPFRQTLERKTGFHFSINVGKNGAGKIAMKFSSEEEFNSIYQFLTEC